MWKQKKSSKDNQRAVHKELSASDQSDMLLCWCLIKPAGILCSTMSSPEIIYPRTKSHKPLKSKHGQKAAFHLPDQDNNGIRICSRTKLFCCKTHAGEDSMVHHAHKFLTSSKHHMWLTEEAWLVCHAEHHNCSKPELTCLAQYTCWPRSAAIRTFAEHIPRNRDSQMSRNYV